MKESNEEASPDPKQKRTQSKRLLSRGNDLNFTTGQGKSSVRKWLRIIHLFDFIFSPVGGARNRGCHVTPTLVALHP